MRIKRTKAHFAILDWADRALLGIIHDAEIDNHEGLLLRIIDCLEEELNAELVEFQPELTPMPDNAFDIEYTGIDLQFKVTEAEDYPGEGSSSYYYTILLNPVFSY